MDFAARFFGDFDEIIPKYDIYAVVVVFEGFGTGEFDKQEDEVKDIRWFSIDQSRSMSLAFTHNEMLEKFVIE